MSEPVDTTGGGKFGQTVKTNMPNQAGQDNRRAYRQHHGFQKNSLKTEVLLANIHHVDL
jgi:hypothetical protein